MSLIERLRRSYVDHGTNYVQEAADALERLTAELEATKKAVQQNYFRVVEVTAERDALKADAERYRWLRNDSYDSEIGVWECRDMENRRIVLAGEELDDSVDAAIQGAKND